MAEIKNNSPSASWKTVTVCVLCGIGMTLLMIKMYHLAESPRFCGACHSMKRVTDQWNISKHRQFACVDCHMPVGNIYRKITYKTVRGAEDLFDEVFRRYSAASVISREGKSIVNDNCVRCHFSTVANISPVQEKNCLTCHRYLVHGRGQGMEGLANGSQ